jgi:hypothetical protein
MALFSPIPVSLSRSIRSPESFIFIVTRPTDHLLASSYFFLLPLGAVDTESRFISVVGNVLGAEGRERGSGKDHGGIARGESAILRLATQRSKNVFPHYYCILLRAFGDPDLRSETYIKSHNNHSLCNVGKASFQ